MTNAGGFTRLLCDVPRPGVARIVLASGPDNPLDAEVCQELYGALGFVASTPAVRALVLGGEGAYFCSGGEIPSVPVGEGKTIGPLSEVLKAIHNLGKPSIAAIDGKVTGSGLALALATDLAVAGPGASLHVPEPAAGSWSFHVLAELVPVVGRRVAAQLFLDGQAIDGAAAASLGLVNHVATGSAMDDALDRAVRYAAYDPAAVGLGLPAMRRADTFDPTVFDVMQGGVDHLLSTKS